MEFQGELEHKSVKTIYPFAQTKNHGATIANHEMRKRTLRRLLEREKDRRLRIHGAIPSRRRGEDPDRIAVTKTRRRCRRRGLDAIFGSVRTRETLGKTAFDEHHHISEQLTWTKTIPEYLQPLENDPAFEVCPADSRSFCLRLTLFTELDA